MRNNGSNPFKLKCFLQRSPFNRIDHPPFSLESLDARYAFKGFSGLQMKNPRGACSHPLCPQTQLHGFLPVPEGICKTPRGFLWTPFHGIDPLDFDSQWTRGGPLNAVEGSVHLPEEHGFSSHLNLQRKSRQSSHSFQKALPLTRLQVMVPIGIKIPSHLLGIRSPIQVKEEPYLESLRRDDYVQNFRMLERMSEEYPSEQKPAHHSPDGPVPERIQGTSTYRGFVIAYAFPPKILLTKSGATSPVRMKI